MGFNELNPKSWSWKADLGVVAVVIVVAMVAAKLFASRSTSAADLTKTKTTDTSTPTVKTTKETVKEGSEAPQTNEALVKKASDALEVVENKLKEVGRDTTTLAKADEAATLANEKMTEALNASAILTTEAATTADPAKRTAILAHLSTIYRLLSDYGKGVTTALATVASRKAPVITTAATSTSTPTITAPTVLTTNTTSTVTTTTTATTTTTPAVAATTVITPSVAVPTDTSVKS
jgi:hypothetical protein